MHNQATILITGADGFIGSHLTEMLAAKGYRIKALSQYNSFNNWAWLEDVNCKDQIEVLAGDVCPGIKTVVQPLITNNFKA